MKILLSGSSGFLGSYLKHYFKDKLEIYTLPGRDIENYLNKKDININEYSFFIHAAEPALRSDYNNDLSQSLKNNISILSKKFNTKLIYFSTALVYGDNSFYPNDESSQVESNDEYTKLKLSNEKSVLDNQGMVIRLSNVIGHGMHSNNVFGDIKIQIDNKCKDITVYTQKPIRDYIYVEDVCNFIEMVISSKNKKYGIYNIGSGVGTSVKEIIDLMAASLNYNYRRVIETKKIDKISCNIVSTKKANHDFNWMPQLTFKDIIDKIYS